MVLLSGRVGQTPLLLHSAVPAGLSHPCWAPEKAPDLAPCIPTVAQTSHFKPWAGPQLSAEWRLLQVPWELLHFLARRQDLPRSLLLTPAWGGGPGDRVGGDSASSTPSAPLLQSCFYQVWESMEAPGQLWISWLTADNPGSRGSRLLCIRLFVLLLPSVSSPGSRKRFCAMGSDRKLVTDDFWALQIQFQHAWRYWHTFRDTCAWINKS